METLKNWKVLSTAGGKILEEVKIQRGILQGDMISSLFLIAVIAIRNCLEIYAVSYAF